MKRKRDKEEASMTALAAADAAAPKKKDKKIKKALKKFASQLVVQASDENWEEHEVAKLLALIVTQLQLSTSKLEKFLSSLDCITPTILNGLNDCGFKISSIRMLHMLYNSSHGMAHFQRRVSEALDQDMFTVTDSAFIDELTNILQAAYDIHTRNDIITLAKDLCSHCSTYGAVGSLLSTLTSHLLDAEAVNFVADVLSYEFIYDLQGSLNDLYRKLPLIRSKFEEKLNFTENVNGRPIESDEDENGDLMDFVCDDDEISYATSSDDEGNSDESDEFEEVSDESEVEVKPKRNVSSSKKRKVIQDDSESD